mmetsp:Transcript_5051/g.20729  ORF Transcript_5051/g.20729 Transcript_5051/m.20729 type:complete len:234 (-) Transcript_5051:321-1022(-)
MTRARRFTATTVRATALSFVAARLMRAAASTADPSHAADGRWSSSSSSRGFSSSSSSSGDSSSVGCCFFEALFFGGTRAATSEPALTRQSTWRVSESHGCMARMPDAWFVAPSSESSTKATAVPSFSPEGTRAWCARTGPATFTGAWPIMTTARPAAYCDFVGGMFPTKKGAVATTNTTPLPVIFREIFRSSISTRSPFLTGSTGSASGNHSARSAHAEKPSHMGSWRRHRSR